MNNEVCGGVEEGGDEMGDGQEGRNRWWDLLDEEFGRKWLVHSARVDK